MSALLPWPDRRPFADPLRRGRKVGGSVAVYVKLEDVDLHNETLLQSMDELVQKIADNKWVSSCSVTDLPKFMMLAYNSTTGRAEFYKSLKVCMDRFKTDASMAQRASLICIFSSCVQ